jgi:hypothetical protein
MFCFSKFKLYRYVGGHRFETSRQTLTSVPDTYFASLFSGRFELTLDDDSSYFIDRDGTHFKHILNCLRDPGSFKLNAEVTEGQRDDLEVEAKFYGLLDRVMPYREQELIGRSLVQAACRTGRRRDIWTAMMQARVLEFDMGSTTPFLTEEYQDSRWVITNRVVNRSPVWAAVGGESFMFRDEDDSVWARVPDMRITAVHGLDDDDPAMAAALRQLTTPAVFKI